MQYIYRNSYMTRIFFSYRFKDSGTRDVPLNFLNDFLNDCFYYVTLVKSKNVLKLSLRFFFSSLTCFKLEKYKKMVKSFFFFN